MERGRRGQAWRLRGQAVGVWLLLIGASVAASVACRSEQASEGVGGQSGDEGRRPTVPWLGTGGVAAEPPQRR